MNNQVTEAKTQRVNKYIKTSPWLVKRGMQIWKGKESIWYSLDLQFWKFDNVNNCGAWSKCEVFTIADESVNSTSLENSLATLECTWRHTCRAAEGTYLQVSIPGLRNYTHSWAHGDTLLRCCNLGSREKWKQPQYFSVEINWFIHITFKGKGLVSRT